MAVTGISLVAFLVVHCGINALVFFDDNGAMFNSAAEYMAHTWYIRVSEIGLFVGLLLHIIQGLWLTSNNNTKRKQKYGVNAAGKNSKWYSRSMGLLGTIILLFLIMHLKHFWVVSRFTDKIEGGEITLFQEMVNVFASPLPVIVYVLGCISLCYHLLHGFQSAFQTFGVNHPAYTPIIQKVGVAFSIIVSIIFAAIPVVMHLQIITLK